MRLMKAKGLVGVSRRKGCRTTSRDDPAGPVPDLVELEFAAEAPQPAVGDGYHLGAGLCNDSIQKTGIDQRSAHLSWYANRVRKTSLGGRIGTGG